MKKILKFLSLFVITVIFITGCSKEEKISKKPFIVFSNQPVNERTIPMMNFKKGNRVYFAVVNPKGFTSHIIKVQIFKKDDKTNILGYSYHSNKDYRLENQHYFLDYFVIHGEGHYIMQVFEITNLQKASAIGEFWIGDR